MQSTSRTMNVLLILLLWLAGGCASDRPPSGGPADSTPLQVILSDPAPSSVNASGNRLRLTFNHYVTGRELLNALHVTPSIGEFDITIDGKNAELRPGKALKQNQTYILTLDKNLRDNNGRTLPAPFSTAFSTGAVIDSGIINGKVINRDFSSATNALILAFAEHPEAAGTGNLLTRKPDYIIQAESSGTFSFRHIATGSYRILAINDRNNDFQYTVGSEEIGLSSMTFVPTGFSGLLFRLSGMHRETQLAPVNQKLTSSETGSISGTCFAFGQYLIVEASSSTESFRTVASRGLKGTFRYSFADLPSGSYTVSAYVPSNIGSKKPDFRQQWNPGSINPFQPADPFGYYPEKVTVRTHWSADHIDIHIKPL